MMKPTFLIRASSRRSTSHPDLCFTTQIRGSICPAMRHHENNLVGRDAHHRDHIEPRQAAVYADAYLVRRPSMQAMSMREELHVSAQSHLLKHLAWQPISTDVDAMVVVAF